MPEFVLDKIAEHLSATDLLSFSHLCSKLFRYLSTLESLGHQKLTNENRLPTSLEEGR